VNGFIVAVFEIGSKKMKSMLSCYASRELSPDLKASSLKERRQAALNQCMLPGQG
jgi:hypothetical protein